MSSKSHAPRLVFDVLESREMPAVLLTESFDQSHLGQMPTAWSSWQSDSSAGIAATLGRSVSGATGITASGNSKASSRAWVSSIGPADIESSAAIYADTLSPASVYIRGKGLDTAKPSYYATSITRGVEVKLVKVIDGAETTLGSIKSKDYVSEKWLKISVHAIGSTLSTIVQRLDTKQWLTSTGTWSSTLTAAITAKDSSITGGGGTGISRQAGTASPVTFDDFAVQDAEPIQPPNSNTSDQTQTALPATPDLARKFTHIRIAQLAYSGNTIGVFEQDKLKNAVDLVIPNDLLMGKIDTASPNVPQMSYTNISNLYLDELLDWDTYADANAINRETAFYHVSAATPWQGSSPSSVPVNWFWNVSRGKADGTGTYTDLTSASRGGRSFGVAFGTTGDAVSLGYTEKFRELNITLTKAAAAGYGGVWEYPVAVDSSGNVTKWKTLTTLSDTTAALKSSGTITFDPPADWVANRGLGSTQRLFSVRFRTTSGTAAGAPEAKTILGRDYASANGASKGTIPAFDKSADLNSDGYLSDAEYAKRKAGFDARFTYESRLFYPYYGQQRFVVNPSSAAIRNWAVDFGKRQLAANPLADGLFIDNSNGKLPFAGTAVIEPITNYTADSAKVVGAVWTAVSPKLVVANTVGSQGEGSVVAGQSPIALEEFLIRPSVASWTTVEDVAGLVKSRLAAASSPYVILDSHPGTTSVSDPRTQIGTLAYYYLVADPNKTMLMFYGGYKPNAAWQDGWIKAAETDVGQPTGDRRIFARGADPQNLSLEYRVYARDYGNALVLYKPRSYTKGVTGTTDDATATVHQLGGKYRTLNADGTLGPVITQITLRNGEGAVLMKA